MTAEEIKDIVRCGETSTVQFKLLFNKAEDIANELIAFSNSKGGRIFDDRVEIISPGALHPTLTVDDIKLGNAYQRNQLMATLCAKTMDYRGLGSGIIRALKSDADIEFHNEVSGDQFRVILWRKAMKNDDSVSIADLDNDKELDRNVEIGEKIGKETVFDTGIGEKIGKKTAVDIGIGEKIGKKEDSLLNLLSTNPNLTISKLAHASGMAPSTVQVYLDKLRAEGRIKRVGPDKGGHWEVTNPHSFR